MFCRRKKGSNVVSLRPLALVSLLLMVSFLLMNSIYFTRLIQPNRHLQRHRVGLDNHQDLSTLLSCKTVGTSRLHKGTEKRRGIYFIANDGVYEETAAFLASFRHYNPTLPAYLIPYKGLDSIAVPRFHHLLIQYNVCVYFDASLFTRIDQEVSNQFDLDPTRTLGHFRKLAMWFGPLDEFLYLDVDSVIVSNVDPTFQFLDQGLDVVTGSADYEGAPDMVWLDSIRSVLEPDQVHYSANTGTILSSKRFGSGEDLMTKALTKGLELREHMFMYTFEQPLLNYLFVTSGKRYDSFLRLTYPNMFPGRSSENTTAGGSFHPSINVPGKRRSATTRERASTNGTPFQLVVYGEHSKWNYTISTTHPFVSVEEEGTPVFQVHWAGYDSPEDYPHKELWQYFRDLVVETQ